MQVTYQVNPDRAQKGQTYGDRESRPFTLPALPQITTITIADASPAAAEAWTFQARDDRTGQEFDTINFVSGASLALTLDAWLAAVLADGRYRSLFTFTEDGATDFVITARTTESPYTFTTVPGGSATATAVLTQASGGASLPVGTMVARSNTNGGIMNALTGTSALANLAGILFRTDFNNFQDFDEPVSGVDRIERARTMSVLRRGYVWVETEEAVTDISAAVFVRRGGSGVVGDFRVTADGGDTIDVSSICEWQGTASAGGLAPLYIDL